jgi:hypothetical protein
MSAFVQSVCQRDMVAFWTLDRCVLSVIPNLEVKTPLDSAAGPWLFLHQHSVQRSTA